MSGWYETREDARNDFIAEIVREAEDTDFEERVADAIESGEFDAEVLQRTRVIAQDLGILDTIQSLKQILGEMEK